MHPRKPAAIAIRHVVFEDLGLLGPILDEAGWEISYREAPTDTLTDTAIAEAELLILLGGPIGVYEIDAYPFLAAEIAVLERRLAQKRPVLGICLGSQLMARALGAEVFPGPTKEIGWGSIELSEAGIASPLAALADEAAAVLHWHGDTFDLPAGAVRLASTALYKNQAFAVEKYALGLQFHIEADPGQLEKWFVGHAAELSAAGVSVRELRAQTRAVAKRMRPQAERIFPGWLRQIVDGE
jgi:GMP synthase (glutamine-hydrolysing)